MSLWTVSGLSPASLLYWVKQCSMSGMFLLSCQFKSGKEFDMLPTVLCPKPDGLLNLIGHRVPKHSSASATLLLDFLHTANIHPLVEHECSLNTSTRLSVLENWTENLHNQQHGSQYKDNYVSKCFCFKRFYFTILVFLCIIVWMAGSQFLPFSVFFYSSFHLIGMEIKCLDGLAPSLSPVQFLSLVHYKLTFRFASFSFHDRVA